jgi:hypothetical protein
MSSHIVFVLETLVHQRDAACGAGKDGTMNRAVIIFAVIALAAPAQAEGPLPQPKLGTCPAGYEASGNYCVPNRNTRCRAMPKLGATCPIGYSPTRAGGGSEKSKVLDRGGAAAPRKVEN